MPNTDMDSLADAIRVRLTAYLSFYVAEKKLGTVFDTATDFELPEIGTRRPSVAFCVGIFVAKSKVSPVMVVPDLAIEIISNQDNFNAVDQRILDFQEANVKLIWVIRPKGQLVEVWRLHNIPSLFTAHDTLLGEDVLPGFRLPIGVLFEGLV